MARAKRTDNKGRVLRNGESQNKKDGRYCYMNVYNHVSIERMQNEMKKLDKYM